jgi:hypothetical protein
MRSTVFALIAIALASAVQASVLDPAAVYELPTRITCGEHSFATELPATMTGEQIQKGHFTKGPGDQSRDLLQESTYFSFWSCGLDVTDYRFSTQDLAQPAGAARSRAIPGEKTLTFDQDQGPTEPVACTATY